MFETGMEASPTVSVSSSFSAINIIIGVMKVYYHMVSNVYLEQVIAKSNSGFTHME